MVSLSVTGLPPAHVFEANVPIVVMEFGERWSVTTEVLREGSGAVWGEPYVSAWPRLPLDADEDLTIKARVGPPGSPLSLCRSLTSRHANPPSTRQVYSDPSRLKQKRREEKAAAKAAAKAVAAEAAEAVAAAAARGDAVAAPGAAGVDGHTDGQEHGPGQGQGRDGHGEHDSAPAPAAAAWPGTPDAPPLHAATTETRDGGPGDCAVAAAPTDLPLASPPPSARAAVGWRPR